MCYNVLKNIAENTISPVLISFVWWALSSAEKKGSRLYFLARDGYIMYKIALSFCARFGLMTDCRYLYGSRAAWRTAVYNIIPDGEKYEYIFSGGYKITPRVILGRVLADKEQRYKIYRDINFLDLPGGENRELCAKDLKIFAGKLKSSAVFGEYLRGISKKQLENVSNYFRQEGLFDAGEVAFVDSGWIGTLQRNLRQILEYNMRDVKITGYYFGLYARSYDIKDGEYNTWYFSPGSKINLLASFNNNVFECMCATPFEMTLGYEYSDENGRYVPVFNAGSSANKQKAELLNRYIEDYTERFLKNSNLTFGAYSGKYLEESVKILQRFMLEPTKEEAREFGCFKFCDDASDCYENNLARFIDKSFLGSYNIFTRLTNKLYKSDENKGADLFWFHGSAAISGVDKNLNWYKFNYKLWEIIRVLKKTKLKYYLRK